jgi:hypothetical protein
MKRDTRFVPLSKIERGYWIGGAKKMCVYFGYAGFLFLQLFTAAVNEVKRNLSPSISICQLYKT